MHWFIDALKTKYAVFSGRARRAEYWYFILFAVIFGIILAAIDAYVLGAFSEELGLGLLSGVFYLALIVPALAVGARRLHDIGRSGWWQLLSLVPVIGSLVLLVFFILDSQPEANKYGPNPKLA